MRTLEQVCHGELTPTERVFLEHHLEFLSDKYLEVVNAEFAIEELNASLAEVGAQRIAMEEKLAYQQSFRYRVKPFLWALSVLGVIKIGAWIIERCL